MSGAQDQSRPAVRQGMSGVERLSLRVSSMINHPIAQLQRWVTIHRLDTDGDREWEEVVGVLAETDELSITHESDSAITVRWEPVPLEDRPIETTEKPEDEPAPF